MSAEPLNKECAYCVRAADGCSSARAACTGCFERLVGPVNVPGGIERYRAWQARAADVVEREFEAASDALSNASNVVGLVWEYLKANPKASTTEAEERALQFITWRTSFVEAAEVLVDRLNAERKAMSK